MFYPALKNSNVEKKRFRIVHNLIRKFKKDIRVALVRRPTKNIQQNVIMYLTTKKKQKRFSYDLYLNFVSVRMADCLFIQYLLKKIHSE